MEKSMMMKAAN